MKIPLYYRLLLEVILKPSLWLRNERTSPEFDKWLWNSMEEDILVPIKIDAYTCRYGPEIIWIENRNYADVCVKNFLEHVRFNGSIEASAIEFVKSAK
jgi:hypothetical protein